jgi:hypothetical protein
MAVPEENDPISNEGEKIHLQPEDLQHEHIEFENIPRKRYFFGIQGRSLRRNIAIAGSIGFFLFGYDQGVLGVCLLLHTAPDSWKMDSLLM